MELRMKTIAALAFTASCLAFTLPSLAHTTDRTEVAAAATKINFLPRILPRMRKPIDCKIQSNRSQPYCKALETAEKQCLVRAVNVKCAKKKMKEQGF